MRGGYRGSAGETRREAQVETHCGEESRRSGGHPFEVDTTAWMLFRQRLQVREKRTLGVRAGKRVEPGWLAKPAKRTEPNISRAALVFRIQVATIESGRKPGYAAAVDLTAGRGHYRPTRTDAHGRTNVSLARRQADQLSAGETWRGEVVIFGWQPCSEADQQSMLRRFRIRKTSHQPMSSERTGKSVRAERKRVARLAVWCVEGRNEPVERSIGKTLVLARVARSVVAGHGLGREHGRRSPNDQSVSNGRPVGKREPEVLP
jgi:hypothetical protein